MLVAGILELNAELNPLLLTRESSVEEPVCVPLTSGQDGIECFNLWERGGSVKLTGRSLVLCAMAAMMVATVPLSMYGFTTGTSGL